MNENDSNVTEEKEGNKRNPIEKDNNKKIKRYANILFAL